MFLNVSKREGTFRAINLQCSDLWLLATAIADYKLDYNLRVSLPTYLSASACSSLGMDFHREAASDCCIQLCPTSPCKLWYRWWGCSSLHGDAVFPQVDLPS